MEIAHPENHLGLIDHVIHYKHRWRRALIRKLSTKTPPKREIVRINKAISDQVDQEMPIMLLDRLIKDGFAMRFEGNRATLSHKTRLFMGNKEIKAKKVGEIWEIRDLEGELITWYSACPNLYPEFVSLSSLIL